MSVTYERREALFLRMAEILAGMMAWVRVDLCPPPSHGVRPWDEISREVADECGAIRDELDQLNITGEAVP